MIKWYYLKVLFISFQDLKDYWNKNFDVLGIDAGYNMINNRMPVV